MARKPETSLILSMILVLAVAGIAKAGDAPVSITLGSLPNQVKGFSGTKVAFTRIPDKKEFTE